MAGDHLRDRHHRLARHALGMEKAGARAYNFAFLATCVARRPSAVHKKEARHVRGAPHYKSRIGVPNERRLCGRWGEKGRLIVAQEFTPGNKRNKILFRSARRAGAQPASSERSAKQSCSIALRSGLRHPSNPDFGLLGWKCLRALADIRGSMRIHAQLWL